MTTENPTQPTEEQQNEEVTQDPSALVSVEDEEEGVEMITVYCCDKATDTELDAMDLLAAGDDSLMLNLYKCVQCPRIFQTVEVYNDHVEAHNRVLDASYTCDFCDRKFSSFNRITMHLYSRHKHGLPFTCIDCNNLFKNRRALNKHRRLRHAPYRPSHMYRSSRHRPHNGNRDMMEGMEEQDPDILPHIQALLDNRDIMDKLLPPRETQASDEYAYEATDQEAASGDEAPRCSSPQPGPSRYQC